MHNRSWCHVGRNMVGWQRGVGPLATHIVPYPVRILLWTWEAIVWKMRRSVMSNRLLGGHARVTWNE
jgi:hypothetical protein